MSHNLRRTSSELNKGFDLGCFSHSKLSYSMSSKPKRKLTEKPTKLSSNKSTSAIKRTRTTAEASLNNVPSSSNMVEDIENICSISNNKLPENVAKHIHNIEKMREKADAPVDTMGCHMLADKSADPKTFRFQVLVALMLSSQTRDQVVAAAMGRLKSQGCTINKIIEEPQDELAELLYPVGFYKRKAVHLKRTASILKEKFDSDIPHTFDGLVSLPGVGPKMAHLAMQTAFGKTEGIGVDTHVHRIANRLHWVKTMDPIETEAKLTKILPRERWSTINKLLVGFGQQICVPVRPKCEICINSDCCPSSTAKKATKNNKRDKA